MSGLMLGPRCLRARCLRPPPTTSPPPGFLEVPFANGSAGVCSLVSEAFLWVSSPLTAWLSGGVCVCVCVCVYFRYPTTSACLAICRWIIYYTCFVTHGTILLQILYCLDDDIVRVFCFYLFCCICLETSPADRKTSMFT